MNTLCTAKTLSEGRGMSTSERLKEVLVEELQNLSTDPSFAELQAFCSAMQEKGLVLKQEYSLPPLDTIGRTLHNRVKSM
jgi:hypothetical protein